LPVAYRPAINRQLLPFGKYIRTGPLPHCPDCPLLDICSKIGVERVRKPTGQPA
jgi:endonuclease III